MLFIRVRILGLGFAVWGLLGQGLGLRIRVRGTVRGEGGRV